MTLPATGTISLSQVDVELSRSSVSPISLGENGVRTLAGVPTGTVGMSSLRGKSAASALSGDATLDYSDGVIGEHVASVTFHTDGSTSVAGGASVVSGPWHTIQAGAGGNFWFRFILGSKTFSTPAGDLGSGAFHQGSSDLVLSVSNSPNNEEGTGTGVVHIYSDGLGNNEVATFDITWSIGFAH